MEIGNLNTNKTNNNLTNNKKSKKFTWFNSFVSHYITYYQNWDQKR